MSTPVTTKRSRAAVHLSPIRDRRLALLLVLPAVALVLLALGYPILQQLLMSFQEFGLAQQFGQPATFVGFDNYITVMQEPAFWAAFARSVVFGLACASATMIIGTAAALLLTVVPRIIAMGVQAVMLVAWAMPVLSSLQVFQWLFNDRRGVVNFLLTTLGLDSFSGYNWLSDPLAFFTIAGLLVTWMSVPLVVFMVYAALTQLDESMLEAARLDGASGLRMFFSIILPSIRSVFLLVGLLQIIWDLRVFTQISVLQGNSGISQQTHVLGTYIYQTGLGGGNYGIAAAAAMVMLALMVLLTGKYIQVLLRGAKE